MKLHRIALFASILTIALCACGSDEPEETENKNPPDTTTIKAEDLAGTFVFGTDLKEYITLWYRGSPNGGELGDYVLGTLDRGSCVTWELKDTTLELKYFIAGSTFAEREETTDSYSVSKDGDALVLTDAEDASRVFVLDPVIENYKESIFDSDLQGKKWIGSNGDELTFAASGNTGTVLEGGEQGDITWERSPTSRVVYVIRADGKWTELEVETDGLGRVTLKDLDNTITYIVEGDEGTAGSGALDQLIAAAKGTGRWTLGGTDTLNGLWIFRKNVLGTFTWYYQANNVGAKQGTDLKTVGDKVVCTEYDGTTHELSIVETDGNITELGYDGKHFLPDSTI